MQGNHSGDRTASMTARRARCSFASKVLAAVASFYGAIVAAEDAGTPAEQSVVAGESAAPGDGGLAEIVVTAQRREQRLGDVGIAVTAMTGETLAQLGVVNGSDIAQFVPSVKLMSFSSSATVFNIRGVSQNDFGDQQEPPVAVYQDDSYASTLALAGFPVFDLARVEVLRGPQGTLFGRNATGGAVQFISNQPTDTYQGYVRGSYGRFDATHAEAAVGGPIAPDWSFRLAAEETSGGNYMKAILPGMHDLGGNNNTAFRGILKWKGAEDLSAWLTMRYLNANHEYGAGYESFEPACPNAHLQGELLAADQPCPYWGSPPGAIYGGYRNPAINPAQGGSPWYTASNTPSYTSRYVFGSQLHLEAKLGEVALTSITDYQQANKSYFEDTDGSPESLAAYYAGLKLKQYSEELRVSGNTGAHVWVAGALGMVIDGHYAAGFALPYIDYFPNTNWSERTNSWAIFGQDEWQVAQRVKLIAGVRFWNDERKACYRGVETSSTGVDVTYCPGGFAYLQNGVPQTITGLTVSPSDADHTFTGVTGRLEADYKPTDDVLLFLSYNRGGKSGGFTFSSATPFDGGAVAPYFNGIRYRPETLTAFELGVKATLNRKTTLSANVFHYNYHDYQAFAQYDVEQTIVNLDAEETGAEAELSTRPFAGLTLSLNASALSSRVKHVPLPDGVTYEDHSLPQTPHFSGGAVARYEFAVPTGLVHVQADLNYSGRFCFTALCAPDEKEPPRAITDVRVGYEVGGFTLDLYGNNITNRAYRVYATDNSLTAGYVYSNYAPPREYGVEVGYRFGR